jgi:hypothetical protein
MGDEIETPMLSGWQACLALGEERLARPNFKVSVKHEFNRPRPMDGVAQRWILDARAEGLTVRILRDGRDLVKVTMRLCGSLAVGGAARDFRDVWWSVVVPFRVMRGPSLWQVVADLGSDNRVENVEGAFGVDRDKLEMALAEWADSRARERDFVLFSFRNELVKAPDLRFRSFCVSTSFADVTTGPSSFLVLMSERDVPPTDAPPAVDPCVLPPGENAVFWIDRKTLERSGGMDAVREAESQMRTRHLGVDIPKATLELSKWAKSVVKCVDLPSSLEFTSMELSEGALMLSATPLSLEELDGITASDLDRENRSLVRKRAEELFGDCLLYHLDERYRKNLLGVEAPKLCAEVEALARPHAVWLREFACLQLSLRMLGTPMAYEAPYTRLKKEAIEARIRKLCGAKGCKELLDRLYPLAFCLVRHRLSLYMDQPAKWLPVYRDYLLSDGYIEKLLELEDPVTRIHDDAAKMNLFDPAGTTSLSVLNQCIDALMDRYADRNWKEIYRQYPSEYRRVFERILDGFRKKANPGPDDWIGGAGGATAIAERWIPMLEAEAAGPGSASLRSIIKDFFASLRLAADGAAGRLEVAAGGALMAVALAPSMALSEDPGNAEIGSYADEIGDAFLESAALGAAIGAAISAVAIVKVSIVAAKMAVKASKLIVEKTAFAGKTASVVFNSASGICFRCLGSALSLLSCVFSLIDLANDWKKGDVFAAVLDGVSAALALVSFFLVACVPESGPFGPIVLVCALIVGTIAMIWQNAKETDEEKAGKALVEEVLRFCSDASPVAG